MKFIKDNFAILLVLVLLIIIFLQRCNQQPVQPVPPTIIRDTVWVKYDSVVYSKPQIITTIHVSSKDSLIYVPDTNYKKLVAQYQNVVDQLLAKNIFHDSVRIDTNGYVFITDTVQKNLITGRSSKINIKYPVIKETIIEHAPPTNQLYVGGGIQGGKQSFVNEVNAGILLKNKKDQIFGASVGTNINGQLIFGVQSFWKIKLK